MMNEILHLIPLHQYITVGIILLLFISQLFDVLKYNVVAKHKLSQRQNVTFEIAPVSVIVILTENTINYIYNTLPLLLSQNHPEFEVVVVNDCGGSEITEELEKIALENPKLRFTEIKFDSHKHSRKIPLVIGIKAAKYENVIMTHVLAKPSSNQWLSTMAKGFINSDIVIGYTGYNKSYGSLASLIRAENIMTSNRFLYAAIKGKAYRGTMYNIGYTKEIFFLNKGFTHLRLALGEDDLFIQKITTETNTSVIIDPQASTRRYMFRQFKRWWGYKKHQTFAFKFYPKNVKINQFKTFFFRSLFFKSTIIYAGISALNMTQVIDKINNPFFKNFSDYIKIELPLETIILMGTLIFIREILLAFSLNALCNRLREKGVLFLCFYDKIEPALQFALSIARKFKPSPELWK